MILGLLEEYKIIEYGNFTLKSQIKSNYYVNLKKVISYPDLHKNLCELLSSKLIKTKDIMICGAPHGAISYTSYISIIKSIPMLF